jgi:hypothetical protein
MATDINTNHLLPGQHTSVMFATDTPGGQPYNISPYNYNGNTGLAYGDLFYSTIPYPSDVVDWVLVTVRKDGIAPADNIWRCAGWVHKNGTVTFPESCPFPYIAGASKYYIMVEHRNHLGVLSPGFPTTGANITCDGLVIQWNFTTADSYKTPFRVGQKSVDGIWAMFAGNGDQTLSINAINSPDLTIWRSTQGNLGYSKADYNMNSTVESDDETKWKNNQNKTSGVVYY